MGLLDYETAELSAYTVDTVELLTWFTLFTLLALLTLFIPLKLLCTAKTLACLPTYILYC